MTKEDDAPPDTDEVWREGCKPGLYTIRLCEVVRLESVSPRGAFNLANARRYAKLMRAGERFPPLLVGALPTKGLRRATRDPDEYATLASAVRGQGFGDHVLVLLDGWHRAWATERQGTFDGSVEAEVVSIRDLEHARWLALRPNTTHGTPLKRQERARALALYLRAGEHFDRSVKPARLKSIRQMARELSMDHTTLWRRLRKEYPDISERLAKSEGDDVPKLDEMTPEELAEARAERARLELIQGAFASTRSALEALRALEPEERLKRLEQLAKVVEEEVEAATLEVRPEALADLREYFRSNPF